MQHPRGMQCNGNGNVPARRHCFCHIASSPPSYCHSLPLWPTHCPRRHHVATVWNCHPNGITLMPGCHHVSTTLGPLGDYGASVGLWDHYYGLWAHSYGVAGSPLRDYRTTVGSLGHFGTTRGPLWDLSGTCVGPLWDHSGAIPGPLWDFWDNCGGPFGPNMGPIWDQLGTNLGPLKAQSGTLWDHHGIVGLLWVAGGPLWDNYGTTVGTPLNCRATMGPLFGPRWDHYGTIAGFWGHYGAMRLHRDCGASMVPLWAPSCHTNINSG